MSDISAAHDYPPEIAKAIIAVKKQVKQLGSDESNKHGGYAYVSVDKFYERIGKLMADAGLALLIDETESEIRPGGKEGNGWLFARYHLAFLHESGAVSEWLRRSLALPINGPQTFGAAQSYIEKQYLRQIFKIPTGEKDADDVAQTDTPPVKRAGMVRAADVPPNGNGHQAKPATPLNKAALPVSVEEPPEVTAARQRVRMLIDKYIRLIGTAPSVHALNMTFEDGQDELREIEEAGEKGQAAAKALREKFMKRISELEMAA